MSSLTRQNYTSREYKLEPANINRARRLFTNITPSVCRRNGCTALYTINLESAAHKSIDLTALRVWDRDHIWVVYVCAGASWPRVLWKLCFLVKGPHVCAKLRFHPPARASLRSALAQSPSRARRDVSCLECIWWLPQKKWDRNLTTVFVPQVRNNILLCELSEACIVYVDLLLKGHSGRPPWRRVGWNLCNFVSFICIRRWLAPSRNRWTF